MKRHDQVVHRLRLSRFTAAAAVVTALLVAPLLLTTDHDQSYTCRAGSLVEVIHPEPEMGSAFRHEVGFDSGYACNRTARQQVGIAVGVVVVAAGLVLVVHRRRSHPASA